MDAQLKVGSRVDTPTAPTIITTVIATADAKMDMPPARPTVPCSQRPCSPKPLPPLQQLSVVDDLEKHFSLPVGDQP